MNKNKLHIKEDSLESPIKGEGVLFFSFQSYYNNKQHVNNEPLSNFNICKKGLFLEYQTRWVKNDKLHRIEGPAISFYYKDNTELIEDLDWHCFGKPHRIEGPAKVFYYDNRLLRYSWYIHGISLTDIYNII